MAFSMTIFLFCIEHVKAFANQNSLSAHETLARRFSSANINASKQRRNKLPVNAHSSARSLQRQAVSSSTRLSMAWSLPSRDEIPPITPSSFNVFGSWYNEMNPTSRSVVYDDSYVSDYSFSSPTDDWPTMSDEKEIGNSKRVENAHSEQFVVLSLERLVMAARSNAFSFIFLLRRIFWR